MSTQRSTRPEIADPSVADVVANLRAQRPALDETIQARIRETSPGPGDQTIEYERGQYAAIVEALDYALSGLERAQQSYLPPPAACIAQARRAAREGVPLDVLLTRYHTGQATLGYAVRRHIESNGHSDPDEIVGVLLGLQDLHNRLTAAVASEYAQEVARTTPSPEQLRAARLRRLLNGDSFDTSGLEYTFDGAWHICVVAVGAKAKRTVDLLASALNRELLPLSGTGDIHSVWLGGSRPITHADIRRVVLTAAASEVNLALGEPEHGLDGWRLTYLQAQAALRIALLDPQPLTRFADVALYEAVLRNRALAQSYVDLHLSPLNMGERRGRVARETLQAYFDAGRNLEVASSQLGVNRATVRRRIGQIDEAFGYQLSTRQAELEVALRVEVLLAAGAHLARAGTS
jgi:hypothetical protein